jgi:hypothetical protein
MFKNQIKLIFLTFFSFVSFFILINFLLAESNQNFLEVKDDIYSNLNNTKITDISNEVLITTSTNIDNNQIETSTSSNLENLSEENNNQENDNQENIEENNEEESNEKEQTELSQSETTSTTTTADSGASTSTSTNNSTNSNDSGSINTDNHQTGGSTFYNSENNSQENNNQENIEENIEEENEKEETEPPQPQLTPEESPQLPLKQRKLEKEVKIDFSAPYFCKAKNFSINITGKNQVFVELELLGTKPQNSTLEIGNLPLGIEITFLNTANYTWNPLPNETTAVLQITNQTGSQKGNFNIIILYTDNSTQKSSICQVNIVNL